VNKGGPSVNKGGPSVNKGGPSVNKGGPSVNKGGRDFSPADAEQGDGSCMIIVATDAPLDARDLKRLAARAVFGLARTGSSFSNGSGDFAIAFSTAPGLRTRFGESAARARTLLPTDGVSPLFQAALEAAEEAVYNSLLKATTIASAGATAEAIPIEKVTEILKKYQVVR
jgi:D-aminopeptidase